MNPPFGNAQRTGKKDSRVGVFRFHPAAAVWYS